jgi:hypothetical protein
MENLSGSSINTKPASALEVIQKGIRVSRIKLATPAARAYSQRLTEAKPRTHFSQATIEVREMSP